MNPGKKNSSVRTGSLLHLQVSFEIHFITFTLHYVSAAWATHSTLIFSGVKAVGWGVVYPLTFPLLFQLSVVFAFPLWITCPFHSHPFFMIETLYFPLTFCPYFIPLAFTYLRRRILWEKGMERGICRFKHWERITAGLHWEVRVMSEAWVEALQRQQWMMGRWSAAVFPYFSSFCTVRSISPAA